ncbi:MAG: ankyrin repeat domain-containing protein [Gemmatimonadaceae bacterium]
MIEVQLFEAARTGDVPQMQLLLASHPGKLEAREEPYEWTLLHAAAHAGRLTVVNLLLERGLDVNAREKGDNTCAVHWAAAAGHLEVVRRLADAGGDVIGRGDDHELEVIGWTTCWDGCDDDAHRAVADFLINRGAHHHIFSAIAMNLADELLGLVAADASALMKPMSRNEAHQLPLHFAVRMHRPRMVSLLLELGADPLAKDGSGYTPAAYATAPDIDRPVLTMICERGAMDLVTALGLSDWDAAAKLLRESADKIEAGGANAGALHLMAKRNHLEAVTWLLDHGADPNARWNHWGGDVTALHLAVLHGHTEVVRVLLEAGADPKIRDTMHNATAMEWAEHVGRAEIAAILEAHPAGP